MTCLRRGGVPVRVERVLACPWRDSSFARSISLFDALHHRDQMTPTARATPWIAVVLALLAVSHGQTVVVVPSKRLVIARFGTTYDLRMAMVDICPLTADTMCRILSGRASSIPAGVRMDQRSHQFRCFSNSLTLPATLLGAVVTFADFRDVDPSAFTGVPRPGPGEILYFVVFLGALLALGFWLGNRWSRPLTAGPPPPGPEGDDVRRRAIQLPWAIALIPRGWAGPWPAWPGASCGRSWSAPSRSGRPGAPSSRSVSSPVRWPPPSSSSRWRISGAGACPSSFPGET